MSHSGPGDPAVPLYARVHLAHAVVQYLADRAGVDLLHVKGPATDPDLRPPGHRSTDADVLVRPGHVGRLQDSLAAAGWERYSDFETGSAFAHAANWFHPYFGYVDVHASWPGPTAPVGEVFERFSADSEVRQIASRPCRVLSRTSQILILVLHAARSPGKGDLGPAWYAASPEEQAAVRALAAALGASLPFAVALADPHVDRSDDRYELWRVHAEGGTRLEEWRARVRAAPGTGAKLRVLGSALAVNRDHLRISLGHPPAPRELVAAQWTRIRRLGMEAAELCRRVFRRGRHDD